MTCVELGPHFLREHDYIGPDEHGFHPALEATHTPTLAPLTFQLPEHLDDYRMGQTSA